MREFEYRVEHAGSGAQGSGQIEKVLNPLGREGWELSVSFQKGDGTVCFVLKRPKSCSTL